MEFHFRGRQTEGEPCPPLFLFGAEDGKSCRWTGAGAQPLGSGKWARATPIVCPKESPLVRPQAHTLFCWGLPRRLRREQWGLPPYGALTLFFRWRKKSVQKKASGTATPGKRLLLPILTAGLAMSRAMELARLRLLSCALGARLFPPSKWADLFPSAAYRRSAPPQLAAGRRTPCGLGCFVVARLLCRTKMKTFVSHTVGDERASPLWGNGLLLLGRFRKVSGQRVWGREP